MKSFRPSGLGGGRRISRKPRMCQSDKKISYWKHPAADIRPALMAEFSIAGSGIIG
jgi:hypothetical protein